jgi:N-acetyl-D-muramate 6-phosphate phosphatase
MSVPLRAAFFDVDGVLVDSLADHLQFCQDTASEFGLKLRVPPVEPFRVLIGAGLRVSPMRYFFRAVGFPEDTIDRAVIAYENKFMERYHPKRFVGVESMLATLKRAGLELGLVTSNTRSNVVPALGDALRYFDDRCLFFFDRYPEPKSKEWCLREGARLLGVEPSESAYIGDQPADVEAAIAAGTHFLGVTYGWGISQASEQYRTANSTSEIAVMLTTQFQAEKRNLLRMGSYDAK